jgi:hypothetical protein
MGLTLPPRLRGPSWPKGFVLFLGLRVACGGVQGAQCPPLALPHPCNPASSLQGERLSPVAVQWCLCTCRCVCVVWCEHNQFFLAWEVQHRLFTKHLPDTTHSLPPALGHRQPCNIFDSWVCQGTGQDKCDSKGRAAPSTSHGRMRTPRAVWTCFPPRASRRTRHTLHRIAIEIRVVERDRSSLLRRS